MSFLYEMIAAKRQNKGTGHQSIQKLNKTLYRDIELNIEFTCLFFTLS